MTALATKAELIKLARALQTNESQLDFLSAIPVPALRSLRGGVETQLFEGGRSFFQKLAAASKLMPNSLVAMLGEKVFGAVLAARIANEMDPPRAIDVAGKMSTPFLADTCLALDPQRAQAIVRGMPAARIVEVSRELAKRKEFVTMARFVDAITPEALKAVIADSSEEVLLRSGFFIESPTRAGQIMLGLPEARLHKLLKLAADPKVGLQDEALGLFAQLDQAGQARLLSEAKKLNLTALLP